LQNNKKNLLNTNNFFIVVLESEFRMHDGKYYILLKKIA